MAKLLRMAFPAAAAIGMALVVPVVDVEAQNRAPTRAAESAPHRAVQYPRIGREVRTLPQGHRTIHVDRQSYRYHNGSFYRSARDGVFVVVSAPVGARVSALPPGYISFGFGPRRYFYANFTYYLWDRDAAEYVVVEEPAGAEGALVDASESAFGRLFVYPREGQSDEQRDRDRFECYLWASEQSGYVPGTGDPDEAMADEYRRANIACLEGRGYSVG